MSAPVTATQLVNAGTDTDHIAEIATSTGLTATDRLGNTKRTLQGALLSIGWMVPVAYTAGLNMTAGNQVVSYSGELYAPKIADLPFTTSGTFETSKFYPIPEGMLRTELSNLDGSSRIGHTNSATDAIEETVETVLNRFISRDGFADDADFQAAGNDPIQKLNQVDIYASSTNWVQLVLGDRGTVLRPAVSNSRTTFNVTPNGTPSGTNTSYGTIRVWGQDVEADPNGSRTSINMEMHYDGDLALRSRLATRSEGTPVLPHPDFYWQVNGSNCLYVGRKKDGTTGRTNWGVFPRGYAFVTSVTTFWSASEVVVAGDKRLIAKSDYLYLECTTGGTTGSSEPTPTNAGTSGLADGTAVWDVKSRLYLAGSTEATSAIPAIWGNEDGNTGFGTLNPQAGYHFASATRFDAGIDFTNASVTGARLKNILSATVSTNFGGTVTAGGVQTASVTVTGAAVGDCVILGLDVDNMLQGLVFQAYVDSTNSVTIQCQNFNASTRNPTTKTYRVTVLKY